MDFYSCDVYDVVDGAKTTIHSGSISGETDIAKQTTRTISGEGENTGINERSKSKLAGLSPIEYRTQSSQAVA
ncbi:hypothetical protein [Lentibacillus salicampi]|uniref:Uncharacterized protein n=1 Tax=Lentibacillus salicampi TaxID=175306 RepID=A0A4Y9A7R4_9BACI|nr:hypothetical protein [Lentibacillus salicampi]TFJ91505.1 hypothetical protein E4U82_17350 [Lentibacillus salicampi]